VDASAGDAAVVMRQVDAASVPFIFLPPVLVKVLVCVLPWRVDAEAEVAQVT
jgi:hypothetical protein